MTSWLVSMIALAMLLVAAPIGTLAGARAISSVHGLESVAPASSSVADLDEYIPNRMRDLGVPGLAIALIRDGQIVWSQGYGVANAITRQPIAAESAFEVASISKPIAAYAALRLVDQGVLSLDEPVISYLGEPWLPPSEYADRITLCHLLSHSSGLTNRVDVVDKRIEFEPGSRYSYSGVGYVYLQEIVESVTGKPLEEVARELVFAPLGMSSSSFVNSPRIMSRLANGHVRFGSTQGLVTLFAPLASTLALTCLAGAVIQRLRNGTWALSARAFAVCYIVAAIVRLGLHAWRLEGRGLKWATLAGLWTALLGLGLWVLLGVGHAVLRRVSRIQADKRAAKRAQFLWAMGSVILLLGLTGSLQGPVPRWPSEPASAAHSLRSTARDLASFLLELEDSRHLDAELVAEMRTPQAPVSANCAYGLGVGLCRSAIRGYIWQGGDNADFHSLMVIGSEGDVGVVVLTNGQRGALVARDVANLALGEPSDWRFHR